MRATILGAMALLLTTAACGLKDNVVVVLPEADGKIGGVVVHQGDRQVVLDQPYAAVHGSTGGAVAPVPVTAEQVQEVFGAALKAKPIPPRSFALYFEDGSAKSTRASAPVLVEMFDEIAKRPSVDVVVIGHTDRVGSVTDNDALALKRAVMIRESLIGRGIDAADIDAAGRGERESLVQTADEVAEPRNRRVEITVR